MLVVKHECKVCGNKFELVSGETLKEVKDREFTYTYAECPKCHVTEIVQVDNAETAKIFAEIIKKVRTINILGKRSKRQSAQLANLNRMLDKKRKELMEEHKGCVVDINIQQIK